jgi:ABC-type transport system substrate-binding protein
VPPLAEPGRFEAFPMILHRARLLMLLLAVAVAPGAFAAEAKVLRLALPDIAYLDPQQINDLYSTRVASAIFEGLYQFDYLATPARVVPNTALAMPEIADDGRTWTIRIRPGIRFTDAPAFRGRPRELTAQDYVYSITRALDPNLKRGGDPALTNLLEGARPVIDAAKKSGKLDYDAKIEGLRAIDRYTLRLKLTAVDYTVLERLAQLPTYAVAREAVEAAGSDVVSRPVGTGPFRLAEWVRGSRVVLEANPDYRPIAFPQSDDPALQPMLRAMRGRRLPALSRIEISIIEEQVPELLAFDQGRLDYVALTGSILSRLLDGGRLKPDYERRGIRHQRYTVPALIYTYLNQDDPVVGGNAPERIALRRAIGMGFDSDQFIKVFYGGQGLPANQLLPPGTSGHDPGLAAKSAYDPAAARALLDRFGYRDRDGDGFRETPDGKPLVLVQNSLPDSLSREGDVLWIKNMAAIGLKMTISTQQFNDLLRQSRAGQLMMFNLGYRAGEPSGFSILTLLWSKSPPDTNLARFRNADYDAAFERFVRTPDGPARSGIARRMSEVVNAYVPIVMQVYPVGNAFAQPWLLGYYPSPFGFSWKYLDIDLAKRGARSR